MEADTPTDQLHHDRILILDFGSQVTQLIARRVRESGVYCEIIPFSATIERIRLAAGPLMNLGDVAKKTVPKMCLVAPPAAGGTIATRNFIPHRVHKAIGVFGAVSVATACVMPGSVASEVAAKTAGNAGASGERVINVEHPTGFFEVSANVSVEDGQVMVRKAALLRTARKLMSGEVYVPG